MPDHKNQHFTPRCLLKSFSLGSDGKAINLYTITQDKLIRNAPLKHQCSRDYFYGADGAVEAGLAFTEGKFVQALDRTISGSDTEDDRGLLRFFAYLQLRRTEMAVTRLAAHQQGLFREIFGVDEPEHPPTEFFMSQSLKICLATHQSLTDLKTRIIVNQTDVDFVIADDPAVFFNKYAIQKLGDTSYGMESSGLVLAMPLTPRLAVICYDGLVYTIPDLSHGRSVLKKCADVEAFNELQFLKASANIYFASWESREYVRKQLKAHEQRRTGEFATFTHAISAGKDENGNEVFKEATKEEAQAAGRSIIHSQIKHPIPSRWLSQIKYRNPIKTYYNNTGAGHVRKQEWLSH